MREILEQFGWWSAIDIFLIAVVFYYMLLLIKGTRTAQMLTGVLMITLVFVASSAVPLTTLNWLLGKISSSIILILVILFQEDMRHALSKIGKRSFISQHDGTSSYQILEDVARAAISLAKNKTGALIVMERTIILSRYIDIGTLIDSNISKEILMAIFQNHSPIHDGAVIIQQGRVSAAGCFLPLTREDNLVQDWGTRHRAAIGISEETDAVVIVVSEERGEVSIVYDGKVFPSLEKEDIKRFLKKHLIDEPRYGKVSYGFENQANTNTLVHKFVSQSNNRIKN